MIKYYRPIPSSMQEKFYPAVIFFVKAHPSSTSSAERCSKTARMGWLTHFSR